MLKNITQVCFNAADAGASASGPSETTLSHAASDIRWIGDQALISAVERLSAIEAAANSAEPKQPVIHPHHPWV